MSLYFHPHIDDPMFNESFNKFEFEYKSNGAILKPWSNQFPEPINMKQGLFLQKLPLFPFHL